MCRNIMHYKETNLKKKNMIFCIVMETTLEIGKKINSKKKKNKKTSFENVTKTGEKLKW